MEVTTDTGEVVHARFCIMATGPLSAALTPDFRGLDTFAGEVYHTAYWPHDGVDFTGKRVAVIGTGSSGVQSIPIIARQAEQLYVFQRTPNYWCACWKPAADRREIADVKANYAERRRLSWRSGGDRRTSCIRKLTLEASRRERRAAFEKALGARRVLFSQDLRRPDDRPGRQRGGPQVLRGEGPRPHRRPRVAELLIPDDHPIGTKRICTGTNYFTTFNRPNVKLMSASQDADRVDRRGDQHVETYISMSTSSCSRRVSMR